MPIFPKNTIVNNTVIKIFIGILKCEEETAEKMF